MIKQNHAIILWSAIFWIFSLSSFGKKTFFNGRSSRINPGRMVAGNWFMFEPGDSGCINTQLSVSLEYGRSRTTENIARFLFGDTRLFFSGSRSPERGENDILADYFGLPNNFKSVVRFKPRITHFLINFNWYIDLGNCCKGLYLRFDMPLSQAKWDLHFKEVIFTGGQNFNENDAGPVNQPAGYLSADRLLVNQLVPSVEEAFKGERTFGDMREPLKFGKIFGRQLETRVTEVTAKLGWNMVWSKKAHFGLQLFAAAPTGNRSQAEFLFEPIVGNNHHWELGIGVNGHRNIFESCDGEHTVDLYVNGHVCHLFADTQKRSYDLLPNGTGSRYMLLAEVVGPSENLEVPPGTIASNQYQGRLIPAINKTTLDSNISIPVQSDIFARFQYQWHGVELGLGYMFYARSAEKLKSRCPFESGRWVVKGDGQVYGFVDPMDDAAEPAVALRTSQHRATIRSGQGIGNSNYLNLNADNPQTASTDGGGILNNLRTDDASAMGITQFQVLTSDPPLFLTDCDINEASGLLPRAITHQFFTHIGNTWFECEWMPYIGGGAWIELADPNVCKNSGYSQWGVWVKGSLAF